MPVTPPTLALEIVSIDFSTGITLFSTCSLLRCEQGVDFAKYLHIKLQSLYDFRKVSVFT